AHYEQTGPEIWEQTEGKITHLVVGAGTGGTITGTGRYLKEKNPKIKVWAIDTYGSALKKYHETGILDKNEIYPYVTEGIGEDFIPQNYDFTVIDHFEKVTDKDAALMTRDLVRKEGIWVGNSAGSAVAGLLQMKDQLKPTDVVVIIFHDHGSRYIAKIFNDDWMRSKGYFDKKGMTASDIIGTKKDVNLTTVETTLPIGDALKIIKTNNFSQLPVTREGRIVGNITENHIYSSLLKSPELKNKPVSDIMQDAMPFIDINTSIDTLSDLLSKNNQAVIVKDFKADRNYIVTRQDVVDALA
nr:pyridoxal-phosphate dependent enzyme [Bacteroidia bacterium]